MDWVTQFFSFLLQIDDHLKALISEYGPFTYAILFAIIFLETGLVFTPLLPGDSLLFAAGMFSAQGALNPHVLLVLLGAAAVLGDTANYAIGRYFGRWLLGRHSRFFKQEYMHRTHAYFEQYGGATIVIARFVPIVRTFAPFVGGMGAMTYARFIFYNVIGGMLWVALCVYAGFFLGNVPWVHDNFEKVILLIIFVSILPGVIEFFRQRRRARTTPPAPTQRSARPKLLLSVILQSLVERCAPIVAPAVGRSPVTEDSPAAPASNMAGGEPRAMRMYPSVGELVDQTAHAGFGFFVGFLALISVPFVGLSLWFGSAIAFGALQMILGLRRPWLPQRLRRVRISPRALSWLSNRLAHWTAGLEHVVRPRFELLTRGPFWTLCGLCILSQALVMALPLPIPGSNMPFIVIILLYAIGLLESDGLLIMLGHAVVVIQTVLAVSFSEMIGEALHQGLGWLAG